MGKECLLLVDHTDLALLNMGVSDLFLIDLNASLIRDDHSRDHL